ncbi:hypothetical protein QFC22_003755 [Naganishia vaughanmartiniae]|uniref:Uncharacterized protein n=1 Tax=Naganishia vaughanmartiniae TaxID=1424756 RepID=A0ACC2X4F6_9TREE|nr:hypothetical protein QFC22_003755 [Naganishia vaughanmartiniae]
MSDTFWDIATMPPNGRRSQGFARRLQQVDACFDDEKRTGFSSACLGEKLNIGYFDPRLERTFGHWGVITNARDMATWLKMLLLGGRSPHTNESVVPYSTIEKTTTAYSVPRESPDYDFPELGKITYGMAQRMSTYRGHRIIEHTGTIPGQTSRIMRVPGSGFGIAVMVNDHELGLHFVNVLTWRIMDHMLRLKPIDWERRLTSSDIQGTYYNEAYGRITLCLASGLPNVNSKTPSECKRTLADHPFDLSTDITDDATSPRFIARFGQTSTMYLLFSHKNESSFIASMGMIFPQTDARMPSIYWYWDAIFAKEGLAFAGNAWGAGLGVKHSTPWADGGLKKNAEVWFDKVVK